MAGYRIARVGIARATVAAVLAGLAGLALGIAGVGHAIAQPADRGAPGGAAAGKDPKVARRWLAIGQMAMQRGAYFTARHRPDDARQQFDNAILAYHKAIEASDDPAVYLPLALAEGKNGQPGRA